MNSSRPLGSIFNPEQTKVDLSNFFGNKVVSGTLKAILYILFCLFLMAVAHSRLKQMVNPDNVSMNIVSFSLFRLIMVCLLLMVINSFQMMVFNLVNQDSSLDIEPSREDSREVLVTSLIDMLTSCSLCWVQGLQCFEWLTLALVINNEKKFTTKKWIAKYHNQTQIREKFNRMEKVVSMAFYWVFGLCTIAYLVYKCMIAVVQFKQSEIHMRNPKSDYVVMREIIERSLPLAWEISIVVLIMVIQLIMLSIMLYLIAKYQKEEFARFKIELISYGIFVFLISAAQVVKYILRHVLVSKYRHFIMNGSDQPSNDLLLTFQILDFKFGLSNLIYFMLILKMKKCEDYIASCSVLKTLTIVSIHQRRIIDNHGHFDGGVVEDLKKQKANRIVIVQDNLVETENSSVMNSEEINDFGEIDVRLQDNSMPEDNYLYNRGNSSFLDTKAKNSRLSINLAKSYRKTNEPSSEPSSHNMQGRSRGSLNGIDIESNSNESTSF